MSDLARVRIGQVEKNMSRSLAERTDGVTVLDESPYRGDGSVRAESRKGGRRPKKKTSVAQAAAEKQAATEDASTAEEANE